MAKIYYRQVKAGKRTIDTVHVALEHAEPPEIGS